MRVKSGGVVQNIPLDDDLCWIKPDLAQKSSDIYTEISENFFKYNEYEGVFSGYIRLKAGSYVRNQEILKLPVGPGNGYVTINGTDQNSTNIRLLVMSDGSLQFEKGYTCQTESTFMVNGTVPIKIGGGVLNFLHKSIKNLLSKSKSKGGSLCLIN